MRNVTRPLLGGLLTTSLGLVFGPASAQTVNLWMTTGDQSKLLQPQTALNFVPSTGTASTTITIDEGTTYQTIDGFGAAMTGSAAYNLNQKMSAAQRDALLTDLFTSSGIRLTFLRHSIGASDFSAYGNYTYDDKPSGQTDPNLTSFSLGQDLTDVVPMLKAALTKNGGIKVMGTPWTAPPWMKESYQWNGGWLSTAWYQTYAQYFVKYVQAMQAQGVPVYAVTLQNEPLYAAPYVSMRMDPGNQAAFLKNNIGPAFQSAGLSTKLIAYDHNWDNGPSGNYVQSVFGDATAAQYAAGSAWHGYSPTSGIPNMTTVHNAFPTKDIWFTEITGSVGSSFAGDLKWHLSNVIIGNTRNWAKSALEWNLALDQNSGPLNGGSNTCRGVVTINNTSGAVTRNVEYYALGHASKFVDPGAVRISSNSVSGGIEDVAFRNPDGTRVLIALNNSNAAQTFKVVWSGQSFTYTLPAGAAATYKWDGNEPRIGRLYEISSKNGGKALEVAGSSTTNGGAVQQRTWSGASNQKWKLVDAGSGYVRVVNLNSNKSLDIVGPSTANGALTQQWDWLSQDDQYWRLYGNGDGTYRVVSKYSSKALDVQGNSTADGASIQQWDYTGGNNQRWWFSDQGAARAANPTAAGPAVAADSQLEVFPTLTDAALNLQYTAAEAHTLDLRLVDVLGRVVLRQQPAGHAGQNRLTLNVADLKTGVYTLRALMPGGLQQQRIVIGH